MLSQFATSHRREINSLLRGESEPIKACTGQWDLSRLLLHVGVIFLGTGLYGAAMGWWRSPLQALYVAIKFPLIVLLTAVGNGLLNAMLAPLLGLNIPARQSFLVILMSFSISAAVLGSFSPLIAFLVWNAPPLARDAQISVAPTTSFNSRTWPPLLSPGLLQICVWPDSFVNSAATPGLRVKSYWPGWQEIFF